MLARLWASGDSRPKVCANGRPGGAETWDSRRSAESTARAKGDGRMAPEELSLRVLVANEDGGRLEEMSEVARSLGADVVARDISVPQVAESARELLPDVAIVGLHDDHTGHALAMIGEIVGEGICPVIAVTNGANPTFARDAAAAGIFAYTSTFDASALSGAIAVAMRRFGQAEQLEGALARRAIIERAK